MWDDYNLYVFFLSSFTMTKNIPLINLYDHIVRVTLLHCLEVYRKCGF